MNDKGLRTGRICRFGEHIVRRTFDIMIRRACRTMQTERYFSRISQITQRVKELRVYIRPASEFSAIIVEKLVEKIYVNKPVTPITERCFCYATMCKII